MPESAIETIKRGGYYTIPPPTENPKLRIIGMNNIDCDLLNLWKFVSRNAMIDQLQWLHDTLWAAEKNGEKVHILMHLPADEGLLL